MMTSVDGTMNAAFKALADTTRRTVLDRLRERNGQTLNELCAGLGMARQSVTQHVDVLARANLVTIARRGRERLHYLNPVPIHEIQQRWIAEFEQSRLDALLGIKHRAEEYAVSESTIPTYVYTTYIRATPEQVWHALTDADLTARYWGHANVSDWQPGSGWEHRRTDGSGAADVVGQVLEAEPPLRLVITFEDAAGTEPPRSPSIVTFAVEPYGEIVRLTVTHERLANMDMLHGIGHGWPAVLANLKSLLETGDVLPQAPWDMAPVTAPVLGS